SVIRARMLYAFRVFAAIYGYKVVEGEDADVRCMYGKGAGHDGIGRTYSATYQIPARYRLRCQDDAATSLQPAFYLGEMLYLFYGTDDTGHPDWLGEIFEWLSGAQEMSIAARDRLGRIPYSHT